MSFAELSHGVIEFSVCARIPIREPQRESLEFGFVPRVFYERSEPLRRPCLRF